MPTRSIRCSVILICFAALLAGCGGGDDAAPAQRDDRALPVPAEPTRGGELVIAMLDDAGRLDPHAVTDAASMRLIENMYSTLLRYGQSYGDLEGDLAESIDESDDHLTYTVHLVEGARFHSGRPVTADAVIASIDRIIEMKVRSQHFDAVATLTAPDEHTVVIELARPVAPFLTYLAYPMNAIVDPRVIEESAGSLDRVDAGSGPFRLIEWRRDRHLKMARFDDYHVKGRPYLERVTYRPIPDETGRTTALRTGEVDLIHEVSPKDVAVLRSAKGVTVESIAGTFWEYLGLNCRRPPFDDPRVRQAVAWAVDRSMINQLVKFGQATVLDGGPIPPNHWAYADLHLYPKRDVAKAKALLAEAGYGEGLNAALIVDASVTYQVRAAEVVKQQLAEAGIDVALRGLEAAVFFDRLGKGRFDLTLVGWMGFVDPDEWTWNLFHREGKYNQQGYANPEVDRLLDEGRTTFDRTARKQIYRKTQRLIASDAPMVFLYVNPQTSAWRRRVRGYQVHPTATTLGLREAFVME